MHGKGDGLIGKIYKLIGGRGTKRGSLPCWGFHVFRGFCGQMTTALDWKDNATQFQSNLNVVFLPTSYFDFYELLNDLF